MRTICMLLIFLIIQDEAYSQLCPQNCNGNCYYHFKYGYLCKSCDDGYYGTYCDSNCPTGCSKCISEQNCFECDPGHFGYTCQSTCSGCTNDICMISSGVCTEGCKDGFYPKTSGGCAECHTNCLTCKAIDLCTACKQSLNLGSICQYDCTGCNNNCDANSGCSNGCSGSSFQFYNDEKNGYECKSCPSACSPCNDQSPCKLCKPGHFGNTCSQQCRPECLTCTGYDDCQSCTNGHRGTACSRQSCNTTNGACFDACKDVWFDDKCSTCKSNRFHQDDSKKICDCTNEYCKSYIRETCTECTLDTWYPKGRGCCPCSSNCLNSLCQNDGSCTECETGKHGTHCNEVCAYGCYNNICHRNGTCVSCRYGRYGPTCNLFCSGTINYCNVCFGQDRNDLACTRCYDYMNRYADGQQCKVCSSNCKPRSRQSCNTTNGACFGGCKDGWFGDKCETKCSVQNCENCSDTDPHECEECTAGFYLNANRACNECPSNCKEGTACNKYSGVCEEGCYNGFSGGHFNITCLPGCRQCDQNDTSSCNVCKYTFYGQSCELPCNLGCVTQNQSQICNKLYGTCDFGCKDGLWDNQCDKPCGVCSKTACNRRTGNCLSPCHDTHYGKACNSQCNENCVNTTGRTCDETDGNCLDGCQVGWFGQQCYNECGQNCKGRICDRNNGSCTSGCIDGYTGSMCSQALLSDDPSGSDATAIGGGAGAGVAVLVILVVIVVVVVLRRRLSRANTSTKRDTPAQVDVSGNLELDETSMKPESAYQNLAALDTTISPDHNARNSIKCTTTYQELNQDTNDSTEYSTLDETKSE